MLVAESGHVLFEAVSFTAAHALAIGTDGAAGHAVAIGQVSAGGEPAVTGLLGTVAVWGVRPLGLVMCGEIACLFMGVKKSVSGASTGLDGVSESVYIG